MLKPAEIALDASNWRATSDFYRSVLKAIDAPEWHGHSPDALNDSMVFGGMNGRQPPYDVVIANVREPEITALVDLVREVLAAGRAELRASQGRDAEVSIRLAWQSPIS